MYVLPNEPLKVKEHNSSVAHTGEIFTLEGLDHFVFCDGWNGEKWCKCFFCRDRFEGFPCNAEDEYFVAEPNYTEIGEEEYEITELVLSYF